LDGNHCKFIAFSAFGTTFAKITTIDIRRSTCY
jgi:hypothetical protein